MILIVDSHPWTLICFSILSSLFALHLSSCNHTRSSPCLVEQSMEVCPKDTLRFTGFRVSCPHDLSTLHPEETMLSCGSWGAHQPPDIVQVSRKVTWTVKRNVVSRSAYREHAQICLYAGLGSSQLVPENEVKASSGSPQNFPGDLVAPQRETLMLYVWGQVLVGFQSAHHLSQNPRIIIQAPKWTQINEAAVPREFWNWGGYGSLLKEISREQSARKKANWKDHRNVHE